MSDLRNAGKYYWHYLKKYWFGFLVTAILIGISTACIVIAPTYLGRAVSELTTYVQHWQAHEQASLGSFHKTLLIYLGLYIGDATTLLISSWVLARITAYSTGTMRVGLFRKMQRMEVQYFDTHSDGDILARYTSDLDNIFNALNQALIEIFLAVAQFIGLLIVMFQQNTTMAWVTMASTPLAILVAGFVMKKAGTAVNHQQDDIGALNGYINEQVTAQKVIITNGLQKDSIKGFQTHNETVRKSAMSGQIWSGVLNPLMQGMSLLNTAIVIFFGSWFALHGTLSTGAALALVVVFVNYAQQYYQPIMSLTSLYGMIQLAITGARRVDEVRRQPDEVVPDPGKTLPGIQKELKIANVHFSYVPGKEILHDVSITVDKGEMVALVGPTGSGKTTVMNLLNRFYDVDSGQITIDGVDRLMGCYHEIIPDRIEAATYVVLAAAAADEMVIENIIPQHLDALLMKLDEIGIEMEVEVDRVRVRGMQGPLKGTVIKTKPYPGFATDIQQPLTTLLTQAQGQSIITETIYPERFKHCAELNKMGADIDVMVPSCFVNGPTKLSGTEVVATDLRCGAALVVAGLIAEGITEIHDVYHIDRGYENLDGKLCSLGAHIWREQVK